MQFRFILTIILSSLSVCYAKGKSKPSCGVVWEHPGISPSLPLQSWLPAISRHHQHGRLFLKISFVVEASNQAKEGQFSCSGMYC